MRFRIEAVTQSGKESFPTYVVNSPLELFDRLARCRSRVGIFRIWVEVYANMDMYWVVVAKKPAIPSPHVRHYWIDTTRLNELEYLEEMAAEVFQRGIEKTEIHERMAR